jgi:hypothetical protein
MGLDCLLDPRLNPAFAPLRHLLKRTLERAGLHKPSRDPKARYRTTSYIDRIIFQNHLEKVRAVTLGFGPYSFLGSYFLPDSLGIRLHHRLQALADRGVAGLRSIGSQYLVLAGSVESASETNVRSTMMKVTVEVQDRVEPLVVQWERLAAHTKTSPFSWPSVRLLLCIYAALGLLAR